MYFLIKPTNISVLSEDSVSARIYALMTVLKGMAELKFLCLNSRENFEDNKQFLKNRLEQENNPAVRRLLENDLTHLDRIQVKMVIFSVSSNIALASIFTNFSIKPSNLGGDT